MGTANTEYSYDLLNRLTQIEQATDQPDVFNDIEYTYGNSGLRTSKVVNTQATDFVYDGSNIVYEKKYYTATPETMSTATYIRGINLICKIEAGAKYFYLYNGHGDVTQIVDNSGNVVNNYNYDEWGNILEENETIQNPFKYAGEYFDNETGYIYLRSRYYDPAIGRFINEDSYWGEDNDPLSLNLYTYCANNPMMCVDPSGHHWYFLWCDDWSQNFYNGLKSRANTMMNNPNWYTIGNWLTLGSFDMVEGAIMPEKPLSLQHWIDSAGTALLIFGVGKGVTHFVESMSYGSVAKTGIFSGSLDGLTAAERKVVSDLLSQGKNVEVIPATSLSKTPDFLVNGIKTELKTISNANVNTAITRIQQGFKQGAQTVIIDGRGAGFTIEQVGEILRRAAGTYKDKILPGIVEIWID